MDPNDTCRICHSAASYLGQVTAEAAATIFDSLKASYVTKHSSKISCKSKRRWMDLRRRTKSRIVDLKYEVGQQRYGVAVA